MNQLFLVGRLTRSPELRKLDGRSSCFMNIAVKRNYKNSDGIYETDFINCKVWNVIAERVCEYCQKGDVVSVKGRIQNNNYLDQDDNQVYSYDIIADQVSFIQSSKNSNNNYNDDDNECDEDLVNVE